MVPLLSRGSRCTQRTINVLRSASLHLQILGRFLINAAELSQLLPKLNELFWGL